jgi:hypothetical protein
MTDRTADDYEPGTRFVVVEIPPQASDDAAGKIARDLMNYAALLDETYGGPDWDLFAYMQHNAPPADVPRLPPATNERAGEAENCLVLAEWLVGLDDPANAEERRHVTLSAVVAKARDALGMHPDDDISAAEFDARMAAGRPVQWADDRWPPPEAFIG